MGLLVQRFFVDNKLGDRKKKKQDVYIALVSLSVVEEATGKIDVVEEVAFTLDEFDALLKEQKNESN